MTRPDPGATARHIELARPDKILAEDALPEDAREDGARDETGGAAALTVGLIKRRRLAAAKTADAADLITYWSALRHGAPFPAPEELNAHHVFGGSSSPTDTIFFNMLTRYFELI